MIENSMFGLAAGGALVGLVTSFWGHIKAVFWKLISIAIQRVEIRGTGYLHPILLGHMIRNYRRSKVYDRIYGANLEHIREQERSGLVPYEEFGDNAIIFWNGLLPFVFAQSTKGVAKPIDPYGNSSGQQQVAYTTLTFLRGTLDVEKIIRESVEERNKQSWSNEKLSLDEQKRFYVRYVPDFTKGANNANDRDIQRATSLPWYQEGRYRLIGVHPDELGRGGKERQSALDALIFPDRVIQLINEIKLWRVNRDWYHKRGIPWKRGWLLYGTPGSGKSALARAFAEDLDMPIWVFNLNELSNFEFMKAWIDMQAAAPCIALIEDIDNVFHGRRNIGHGRMSMMAAFHRTGPKKKELFNPAGTPTEPASSKDNDEDNGGWMGGALSFDVFLNMLDGVERNDGVFTIVTTNNLEHIDEALGRPRQLDGEVDFISTRPGRIDKAIELTYMEPRDKLRMADKILGEYPEVLEHVRKYVEERPDVQETPAQFQERCAQLALHAFWQEQQEGEVGMGTRHKVLNDGKSVQSPEKVFETANPEFVGYDWKRTYHDGHAPVGNPGAYEITDVYSGVSIKRRKPNAFDGPSAAVN